MRLRAAGKEPPHRRDMNRGPAGAHAKSSATRVRDEAIAAPPANPALEAGTSRRSFALTDWLQLHGLSRDICQQLLDQAEHLPLGGGAAVSGTGVSGQAAWKLAGNALRRRFPSLGECIDTSQARTTCDFDSANGRARTIPGADAGGPRVELAYRERASDLLTVAHEFGHAVHLTANPRTFMPPVNREICAFLAELALLDALQEWDAALHVACVREWTRSNAQYLETCARTLRHALLHPDAVYHYDWNYPIARVLAWQADRQIAAAVTSRMFFNEVSLAGLVCFLGCAKRTSPSCDGACLVLAPVPQPEADSPQIPPAAGRPRPAKTSFETHMHFTAPGDR